MSELTAGGIVLAGYGWHLVVGRPYPEPVRDVPGLTHQGRTQLVLVIPCDDEHAPRLFDRELPMYLDLGVATAGPGVPVLLLRVGIAADRPGQELRTVFDAPLTWHIGDAAPPLSVDAVDDLWIVTVLEGGPRRSPSYMRQLTVRRILPVTVSYTHLTLPTN